MRTISDEYKHHKMNAEFKNKIETLNIKYRDYEKIEKFLLAHDYIIEYLFKAYNQIKRIFEENIVEIILEYYKDYEEDYEGLFINIKTNLSPESSLDLLEKFDEEWWLKVDFKVRSVMNIMVNTI